MAEGLKVHSEEYTLKILWWGDSDWAGWLFVIFLFAYHYAEEVASLRE